MLPTQNHRGVGLAAAGFAVLATIMGVGAQREVPEAPFGVMLLSLAAFLYALSLIYFAVHAVGGMRRDHELWKRQLDEGPR